MKINRNELIDAYREAIRKDVPLEWVLEQQEKILEEKRAAEKKKSPWRDVPFLVTMLVGFGFITMAIAPMLSFVWSDGDSILKKSLIAPVPADRIINTQVMAAENSNAGGGFSPLDWVQKQMNGQAATDQANAGRVQIADGVNGITNNVNSGQFNADAPVVIEDQLDYKNLANWFASTDEFFNNHLVTSVHAAENEYTLDIPKLGISNAAIKIGGTNLSTNLVQYETTALPGEYGGPAIFGHSTLRQWYNPSENNPERYSSIFSTIMTLEKGDKITVRYGGMTYTYEVVSKQNVKPTDRDKLVGQDTSGKFLKLITCTPEGTTAMRGIITAMLIE